MGDQKNEGDKKKVPVFTVFKKNSILKNIFLDAPQTNQGEKEEDEQVIVIGRHPDCSITLDHPSISRFHLRLHSNPSSLKLSLVDLSSVHGTWVSGKKVEPGVQVDLNEGDIVQLGASSRLYELHWVAMSRAYDLDVPFVPPMNVLMTVKETEELSNQDENCCSSIETNQIQSQCTSVGDLDLSVSTKEITVSSSSMPEFGDSTSDNEEAKEGNLYRKECKQNEISGISAGQCPKEELIEEITDSENLPNASSPSNDHNEDLCREEHKENEISVFSSGPLLKESAVTKFKNQQSDEEHEENDISGFSSRTPLKESALTNLENQQSDEENDENPEALAGLLNGTLFERSPSGDHNKNLLRNVDEENEISAFSSGQLLNESVLEIVNQQFNREHENLQDISAIANVNSPTIDQNEHSLREELLNKSVVEIEYQQYDEEYENSQDVNGVLSGIAKANSTSIIDHYEHQLREEFKEDENSAFSSGQLLNESVAEIQYVQYDGEYEESQPVDGVLSGIANENSSPAIDHYEHRLLREESEGCEVRAFSSGQLFSKSVLEIECQQYDDVCENSHALDGIISGIADANSSSLTINEQLLRGELEEHEISALSSGQLLNESVLESACQQYDEACENSQAVDGVLSGIADADSIPSIYHNEHQLKEELEKNEISASMSVLLLSESVAEIGNQQCDEDCEKLQAVDGVPSSDANAHTLCQTHHYKNLPKFFTINEQLLRGELEEHEISALSSGQLLNESVLESACQQYDEACKNSQAVDGFLSGIADADPTIYHNEHQLKEELEKNEISASMSVLLLSESVAEIGNQQCDEDCEKLQAVDGVPSSDANAHSLCQTHHYKNLPKFFNSSFPDEDVEIIYASRMQNEQEMSISGCYSPSSSTILERKDRPYPYEQDHKVQYSLSSGIHAIQSSKNTPSKSEQESNWSESMRHSLSDICAVVGESSEALDKESSLKGDNKQKEITVITGPPTEYFFEQFDENINTKESFATNVSEPKDTDVNTPFRPGKQSGSPRSIRVKPTSIDIQTGNWFPTNSEVKELYKDDVDYESVSEALISNVEVFAEEIFTPDQENFTPNTLKQRSTKKTDILEEIKLLDPLCLSPPINNSICWNFVQNEELTFSSDKENHTPKVLQKSKIVRAASKNSARLNVEPATKNKISRIPFKSLLSNSSSKSCRNDTTIGSSNSGRYAQLIEKNTVGDNKRWIMVADTNCLLNKVSMKALQLLQGVKGTQLIIPRVVIRELDCMKRRGYLFTRTAEISSALQWIEDCMINTNWWIHVESLEEGRHFTPAPSLSTSVGEIEDLAFSSSSFSAFLNFLEIVSPTPGDHILECALLNRKMKNDENLVILSDDVSLKIKAMAEGIICEAAEEFRESLVNPFSDRFLWANSSPRGLTWSCLDDIVLREKYYRGPFKKPASKSGESLKGLKLILLQNSHFSGHIPNSFELNCF